MRTRARGFTLIELLVVIAIVAILAAILLPVLAHARQKGKQASCLSNVNQLVDALVMYSNDHDETFPPIFWGRPMVEELVWWDKIIEPYVKNKSVFACPADDEWDDHFMWYWWGNQWHELRGYKTSYGVNRLAVVNSFGNGMERVWDRERSSNPNHTFVTRGLRGKLKFCENPSKLILLADSGWGSFFESSGMSDAKWHVWMHFAYHDREEPEREEAGGWLNAAYPPIGFCDGHVKILRVRVWEGCVVSPGQAYTWKYDWGHE